MCVLKHTLLKLTVSAILKYSFVTLKTSPCEWVSVSHGLRHSGQEPGCAGGSKPPPTPVCSLPEGRSLHVDQRIGGVSARVALSLWPSGCQPLLHQSPAVAAQGHGQDRPDGRVAARRSSEWGRQTGTAHCRAGRAAGAGGAHRDRVGPPPGSWAGDRTQLLWLQDRGPHPRVCALPTAGRAPSSRPAGESL